MAGVNEGVLLDLDDYAGHEQCDAALFHHATGRPCFGLPLPAGSESQRAW